MNEAPKLERFTDRARRVVSLAGIESRRLGHGYLGTEHLLLGLVAEGHEPEGGGVGARALAALGVDLDECRAEVQHIIGRNDSAPDDAPWTPRALKVLEISLREALQLGHNYIGTEHLCLGMVREGEGVAAQVLQRMLGDGALSRLRQQVIQLLSGYAGTDEHEPAVAAREPVRLRSMQAVKTRARVVAAFEAPFAEIRAVIPTATLGIVAPGVTPHVMHGDGTIHDTPAEGLWYVHVPMGTIGWPDNKAYDHGVLYRDTPEEACRTFLAYLREVKWFSCGGKRCRWQPAEFISEPESNP